MSIFSFKPMNENDLDLMHHWFQQPIVKKWYARNQTWTLDNIKAKYLPRILGQENVPSFLVHYNDNPIGFIQYYCLSKNLPEGIIRKDGPLFSGLKPEEIAGIDFFIGNGEYVGLGFGTMILNQFITEHLALIFKVIVVDPDKSNIHAIRCFQNSGFEITDYSENPKYIILIRK